MPAELLVGDPAPDFQTVAAGPGLPPGGQPFRLGDVRDRRAAFVFHPSNDPLGARAQFSALRDAWEMLRGPAAVYGVFHDTPEGNRRTVAELALPFALLSDDGHRLARAFGFWMGDEGGGVDRGGDSVVRGAALLDAGGRVTGLWRETDGGTLLGFLLETLRP